MSQVLAAPMPPPAPQISRNPTLYKLGRFLKHEVVLKRVHALRGRPYQSKIGVAVDVVRRVMSYLDPAIDRVGVSHFDDRYETVQAPTHDFMLAQSALLAVHRAALQPTVRSTRLFHSIVSQLWANQAHSHDRPTLTVAVTDGGDSTATNGIETGLLVRKYLDEKPAERSFELCAVGSGAQLDYAQLGQFREAVGGGLTLLDDIYQLRPAVEAALHRAVLRVSGEALTTPEYTAARFVASLAARRQGTSVVFLIDTSSSMTDYVAGRPAAAPNDGGAA